MKKFIGLVIILVALVLGGYYGMGLITERTLKQDVTMINQSNGLLVDIQRYDRGWFTSTAQLKWRLHIPKRVVKHQDSQSKIMTAQDYTIDMPLTIFHGPVIYSKKGVRFGLGYAETNLILPKQYTEQFSHLFTSESTQPELELSVLVNYLNRSHIRINLVPFKLLTKNGSGQFEWLGMTSDLIVSSDMSRMDGDLSINGLKLMKDNTKVVLGKVTSDYEFNRSKEGLYTGAANLSVPSLIIQENDQTIFELNQFNIHTGSDVNAGLLSTHFETSLDALISNGKTYGPARLKMSIKNLDAQVLANINEQINKMQKGSNQENQQALLTLIPELPKLFGKGPEFQISEMSVVIPEGTIQGNLKVSLPEGSMSNPFQLIQKIEAEGQLKMPKMVLKGLMKETVKQQLLRKPNLPQAIANQMQENKKTQDNQSQDQKANPEEPQSEQVANNKDMEQQATIQAEQKLLSMIQSGLLTVSGDDYLIEVKMENGQLSVNGQPFNSAMIKF